MNPTSTRALDLIEEYLKCDPSIYDEDIIYEWVNEIRTALTDNQMLVEALQKCIKEYKQLNILFLEHGFNRSVNDVKETIEYLENVIANYKEKNHV